MPARGFTHESTYNESKEWYTPKAIFEALGCQFDLDPCSPGADIVRWIPAARHLTIADDGLNSRWFGNVFMNPPYGNDTPIWLSKLAEHGNGIALVFARTDTRWFHKYIPLADAICFIRGRIQFIPASQALQYADGLIRPTGGGCGAASMLIAYGKHNVDALIKSNLGLVCKPLALSESKPHNETPSADNGLAGILGTHENRPVNAETGQGGL